MNTALIAKFVENRKQKPGCCLACGTTRGMNGRRYCSVECRQKLRHALNVRTGLLRALDIRYGTFSFTDHVILLDVLPRDAARIWSFIYPRTPGDTPARDFARMSNQLGNAWWTEKRRTNKRYLASLRVFDCAAKEKAACREIHPLEKRVPAVGNTALVYLKLDRNALDSPELLHRIKSAYRRQAKQHHPDTGGDARVFRRIQHAYEILLDWAENPVFYTRRGFPDRWFYDGQRNRWVQPAPLLRPVGR